jgi:hypothetical protein
MVRIRIILAIGIVLAACGSSEEVRPSNATAESVVEVVTRGLTLEAPSEIPSGWTTFRFRNEAPMDHFVVIEKVPDGQGLESQQREIAPVFQAGMDLLSAGDADAAMAKFGELPAWFGEVVFFGGPGLTSPGQISEATVKLEPGTYLLECYVKTGGIFHSYHPDPAVYGMVHEFRVTAVASEQAEPTAAIHLEISSETGITTVGAPSVGRQTFSVNFVDQIVHENFVGHDIHVARLPEGADLDELEQWMDWRRPTGLQTPSPVAFLGGLNEMPAGSTGYFTVTLEPGQYALVSEVPGTRAKGLLRTFTEE